MMSESQQYSTLIFFVNGKKIEDKNVDPEWTLLYYLRNKLKLCGTKLGCAEGGCGACTVMVSKYDRLRRQVNHLAVNACLAPVCSMHGLAVTTVEGIGSTRTRLHPVQERIAKAHGSQCGFCTPGIVMSMYTLLRNKSRPAMHDLDIAFQGNLCRCTGYRPIIDSYRTFTEEWELAQQQAANGKLCAMGDQCCQVNGGNGSGSSYTTQPTALYDESEFTPFDPTQEPIFPPELKVKPEYDKQDLVFRGSRVYWCRPQTLEAVLDLKDKYHDAKIIVGNTEVGVEVKFKQCLYPVLIQPSQVPELTSIQEMDEYLKVGASVTLLELEAALRTQMKIKDQKETRVFASILDMLHYFAGNQIRSVAGIGGNIMTGSPISDLNPILLAARCTLEVCSKASGHRCIVMDENFFTGYRRNQVRKDEVLLAVHIPFSRPQQYFYAYKQSKRRDDDIAIVNAAVNVSFKPNTTVISDINIAYGGMAATTILAKETGLRLIGHEWNDCTLEIAYEELARELSLANNAPGGMVQYRRALCLSLFFRAYLAVQQQLTLYGHADLVTEQSPGGRMSALDRFTYCPPRSSQYANVTDGQCRVGFVGRPMQHVAASKQACGEAQYLDDLPPIKGELYMALVFSTEAHADIKCVDASKALQIPGVHAFFSAKDLDEKRNKVGPVLHDEEVFVSKTVTSQGQVIGAVIADSQTIAQRAARQVRVEYEKRSPVIITIEDAIKHRSFIGNKPTVIKKGNVEEAFRNAVHVIEGECRTGAQEHFYLETHAVIANPKEGSEMEIICSTQHPSEICKLVSQVLGTPMHQICTRARRLGGGFGGKESRAILVALPAALAAHKLRRPVRCMLDRDEDMLATGTRHPFLIKYKTAFDGDGKITACEVHIYNNAGYSADLSFAVLERAMFHFENAYHIPCAAVYGYVCRTNLPTNTAFRGFGGPQGMFAAENMIRDIAEHLDKDLIEVQLRNLYKEGDVTHYNQKLEHCTLQRCWDECLTSADFCRRRAYVREFNRKNRWKKRGIAVVPTKFGIAFTVLFLNQAGALVNVYTDGSVLLSHGGVEMGQGLHTKMIQVASRVLDIPPHYIHVTETATDKVPNTSATAASAGSDLNGMAVKQACEKIVERLEPFRRQNPRGEWKEWVNAAYMARTSLSATGFYKTPDIGYSFDTNSGDPFNYFTYGVAVSEVEVDCLTGDHQVLRTDIVMDLGESLNPAIDVGQVEGGFMQGYGLFTLEEMLYSANGHVLTRGPGAYKIPGFSDIPIEFNVSLLRGAPNPRAVFSSKAVGEPPLFLASSVLFAIRDAILSARRDTGHFERFRLNAPATAEKIRMGCQDHITTRICETQPVDSETPWNVTA